MGQLPWLHCSVVKTGGQTLPPNCILRVTERVWEREPAPQVAEHWVYVDQPETVQSTGQRKCAKNFAAETFACEADGEMS
jgi:hypothetical protein